MDRLMLSGEERKRLGTKDTDPNELMIQLVTSAIRMNWSEEETERREQITRCRADYGRPIAITPSRS